MLVRTRFLCVCVKNGKLSTDFVGLLLDCFFVFLLCVLFCFLLALGGAEGGGGGCISCVYMFDFL